jgi:hypothetical protein
LLWCQCSLSAFSRPWTWLESITLTASPVPAISAKTTDSAQWITLYHEIRLRPRSSRCPCTLSTAPRRTVTCSPMSMCPPSWRAMTTPSSMALWAPTRSRPRPPRPSMATRPIVAVGCTSRTARRRKERRCAGCQSAALTPCRHVPLELIEERTFGERQPDGCAGARWTGLVTRNGENDPFG